MIHNIGFSDYGWDDIRVPLTSGKIGVGNPPLFGSVIDGVYGWFFDANTDEQLYFEVQMPHDWQNVTTIYPHIHWCGSTNQDDVKVSWGLEYNITSIGSIIGNTTTIYGDTPVSGDEDVIKWKHQLTPIGSGIDMTGFEGVSALLLCRIFRDAVGAGGTDTYSTDAIGLSVDFHYKRWRLGSLTPSG